MNQAAHNTDLRNSTKSELFYPFFSNGKEKDYESGFHYYGARYYWSEVLTGWLSVDPMADKYPSITPYNYCMWNPILFIDPDGEEKLIYYNLNVPHQSNFTGKDAYVAFCNAKEEFLKNSSLAYSAKKYKDYYGVIHLFAHGNSQYVDLVEHGMLNALKLESFLLNNSATYSNNALKGKTSLLIMHSCSTGSGNNPIAQQLSKISNGDLLIFAPSDDALLGDNETVKNNGVWNVFYKGELLGTYKGNTDFRKELEEKGSQKIIDYWIKKYENKHTND